MKERWKTVVLQNGDECEVSDQGTIKYYNKKGEQIVTKGKEANGGYLQVVIGNHHYSVNRLVAVAFINPNLNLSGKRVLGGNNIDVCHKDGDRKNNKLSNLSIKFHKDNCREPRSIYNYMKSNSRLKCGFKNVKCTDNEGIEHIFSNWNEVAEFVNRQIHTCRANINSSIYHNGTAYGCKWSREREGGWYTGKNTKYYRRPDGTRPFIDKD